MRQFYPEKLDENKKILRFLNLDGLKRTLGVREKLARQIIDLNPTFLLRSLDYYRFIDDERADICENTIITSHSDTKQQLTDKNIDPILVSCWSSYQPEDLLLSDVWSSYPKDTVAAIESTVGEVNTIINFLCPKISTSKFPEMPNGSIRGIIQHGEVLYYSPENHDETHHFNVKPNNCFYKRQDPYSKEKEYRFAIRCNIHNNFSPDTYIARLNPINMSYIKKIYIRQGLVSNEEIYKIQAYYDNLVEIIDLKSTLRV